MPPLDQGGVSVFVEVIPGPASPLVIEVIHDAIVLDVVAEHTPLIEVITGTAGPPGPPGPAGEGSGSITVSDTAPPDAEAGDLWWDSVSGQLFVYFTDIDSSAWIIANTGGATGEPVGDLMIDCGPF